MGHDPSPPAEINPLNYNDFVGVRRPCPGHAGRLPGPPDPPIFTLDSIFRIWNRRALADPILPAESALAARTS